MSPSSSSGSGSGNVLNPSTLLSTIALAALTALLPNLQAVDASIKAIGANQPFSFVVLQTQINNIAGQGLIIEADAPALLPVIASVVSAAIAGQADDSLEQVIAWIQAQPVPTAKK